MLQYTSDAFLFINLQGIILLVNAAAEQRFQINQASFEKRRFWDFFTDDYFGFSMRESLAFGRSHRLIYKSYSDKELEITTDLFFEGPKPCHGLILVAREISEKRRYHAVLNQNERKKELGGMIPTMAHEIRNAIGGIRGFASLLYHDLEKNISLQEMAGWIIEGTKRIETLVSSVLHYAKPIQLKICSTDLGVFLRKTAELVKVDPAFPARVKLELHIPSASFLFPIDPDALRAALLNLLFNAIQAMPNGGVLSISLFKLEKCCQITISDTGVGMSQETMQRLFSPFFTTKERGNGLGLVEAKKIIEAHQGRIDVHSTPQKGTTFTILIKQ